MFLTVPTQYPLSVPNQANPMAFEQGPVWMLIILLFTIGGTLLWIMLTRESVPSEATELESEESEPETPETTATPLATESTPAAETTTAAEAPATTPEPVVALVTATTSATSTAETTAATKKAAAKKQPSRPAKKKKAKALAGDDFTRIEGVGPKIDTVLKEAGIANYAQLADASVDSLYTIIREAKIRAATPDTWPEQAALAATEQWATLESLQENLKGGRRVTATSDG